MAQIHINQIKNHIEATYGDLIDFSDIKNFDKSTRIGNDLLISRGLSAFVVHGITGCSEEEAAKSVTDSGDDNGIDAIFYDEKENCVYITQAKFDHDGKGEPDLGSVKKFIDGFNDLVSLKYHKFCKKIVDRQVEIEDIFSKTGIKAKLLLIYTGNNACESNIREFEEAMEANNDVDEWLSYEFITQSKLYNMLIRGNLPTIDTEIVLFDYGVIDTITKSYYGKVSVEFLGTLWKEYGNQLLTANIRALLPKSEVNENMLDTLRNDKGSFWYYNNGITMTCDTIERRKIGGNDRKMGIFDVKNVSIVNGAQTAGTIGAYYKSLEASGMKDEEIETALKDEYVHIRIIQTKAGNEKPEKDNFAKHITINTNMQNKIIARDFASQTEVQRRFRTELDMAGITYQIVRSDDVKKDDSHFTMEEAARARCNIMGLKYSILAHKGTNNYVFKDVESEEYTAVFNPSLTGIELWNLVRVQREIDEQLKVLKKEMVDDKDIIVYGKDFLSVMVFEKLYNSSINKNNIIVIDKNLIKKCVEEVLEIAKPHIRNKAKSVTNLFKNATDIETIYNEAFKGKDKA